MDVPILRTLALKSVIGFGKYKLLTINQIIDLNHTRYLRYIYYNIFGISFNDEILHKIGIIGSNFDYRISKPGIDNDMYIVSCEKAEKLFYGRKNGDTIDMKNIKRKSHIKSYKKHLCNKIEMYDKINNSKKKMQARNHGH